MAVGVGGERNCIKHLERADSSSGDAVLVRFDIRVQRDDEQSANNISNVGGSFALSLQTSRDLTGLDHWFVTNVLPFEQVLVHYIRRHWHDGGEVADLCQEVYIRVYEAAQDKRPVPVKPYLLAIARNLMIDRLRKKSVVNIEALDEVAWQGISDRDPNPEQHVAARQELHRMQRALDNMSPRCREVIVLRRIQGLSQREISQKLGISEDTVESHMTKALQVLADAASDRRAHLIANARRFQRPGD